MAEINDFYKEAQNILKQIENQINQTDLEIIKQKLKNISQNFIDFYEKYYNTDKIKNLEQLTNHQNQLKNLKNSNEEQINSFMAFRNEKSIQQIVISDLNKTKQLQTLTLGLRTLYLKVLGYELIQTVVIEDPQNHYKPIIIDVNFKDFANFISESLDGYRGRLKQNQDMLRMINNRQRSSLYTKKNIDNIYIQIYKQTRRRLNIFYNRIKKSYLGGRALLLYKPERRWIKFFVSNMGDVKEGFVSMVVESPKLNNNIEHRIKVFAEEYIGRVDNGIATLIQDVEFIKQQISVKSGRGQTGSDEELLKLIAKVAKGDIQAIEQVFNADRKYVQSGKGRRNRILQNRQAISKTKDMIKDGSETLAKEAINATIRAVKNVELKGELE